MPSDAEMNAMLHEVARVFGGRKTEHETMFQVVGAYIASQLITYSDEDFKHALVEIIDQMLAARDQWKAQAEEAVKH